MSALSCPTTVDRPVSNESPYTVLTNESGADRGQGTWTEVSQRGRRENGDRAGDVGRGKGQQYSSSGGSPVEDGRNNAEPQNVTVIFDVSVLLSYYSDRPATNS